MTVQDQSPRVDKASSKRNSGSTIDSEAANERPQEGTMEGEELAMNNITSIPIEDGKDGADSDSDCAATEKQPLKVCVVVTRM